LDGAVAGGALERQEVPRPRMVWVGEGTLQRSSGAVLRQLFDLRFRGPLASPSPDSGFVFAF
jgi:hypothetical protein